MAKQKGLGSRVHLATLGLLVLGSAAGCITMGDGPKGADLAAEPALAVDYPGAVELSRRANDPYRSIAGASGGGRAERMLAAEASQEAIFAFYDETWQADGWIQGRALLSGCANYFESEWIKGNLAIGIGWMQLSHVDNYDCGGVDPNVLKVHETVYEIIIAWEEARVAESYEPRPEPTPNLDVVLLQGMPEALLAVPGSEAIHDGARRPKDDRPADVWHRYGYEGPIEDVLDFYRREMTERGWSTGLGSATAPGLGMALQKHSDRQICGWNRDGFGYRLRIWDPEKWRSVFHNLPYRTVYDVNLIGEVQGPFSEECRPAAP